MGDRRGTEEEGLQWKNSEMRKRGRVREKVEDLGLDTVSYRWLQNSQRTAVTTGPTGACRSGRCVEKIAKTAHVS